PAARDARRRSAPCAPAPRRPAPRRRARDGRGAGAETGIDVTARVPSAFAMSSGLGSSASVASLEPDALLAKAARENFPVAPRWLPRALREDLVAIYGVARLADDLGDEAAGDRLAALDALEADLARAAAGDARHPLVRRLAPALAAGRLPLAPFQRLVEANRRDQRVARYADWDQLAAYC